jgi:hypothetical protein
MAHSAHRTRFDVTTINSDSNLPENWLAVDQETGEVWERRDGNWQRAGVAVIVLPRLSPYEAEQAA